MDVLGLILLSVGVICFALVIFLLSLDPPPRHSGEEKRTSARGTSAIENIKVISNYDR